MSYKWAIEEVTSEKLNKTGANLRALAQATPGLTLQITDGVAFFGDTAVKYAGGNSPAFTAPATNPRISLLLMDSAGTISILNGAEAGSPVAPTYPTDKYVIAEIYMRVGSTSIKNNDAGSHGYILRDVRPVLLPGGKKLADNFTALIGLTAGDRVGLSNMKDRTVMKALRNLTTALHNISSPVFFGNNPNSYCPIGGGKFVYLDYTAAGAHTLFAQVGSFDANKNLTLGTAQTVAAAFTPNNQLQGNVAICKLDTDKFAVFYVLDSSTTVIKYRVGNVSGTTITFGTEATFFTAATEVGSADGWSAEFISTNKGVFFFNAGTQTSSKVIAFTCSAGAGTVLTPGTGVTPTTPIGSYGPHCIKLIDADKFVLVYWATNNLRGQVFTCVGGTTLTPGTALQLNSGTSNATQGFFDVIKISTGKFAVCTQKSAGLGIVQVCSVSGTTITAGTPVTDLTIGNNNSIGMMSPDANTVILLSGSSVFNAQKFTITGVTLADNGMAGKNLFGSGLTDPDKVMLLDNGDWVVLHPDTNTTFYAWVYGYTNNFIGIVQATVAAGLPVAVIMSGIDATQSGLAGGATYQVGLDGALTLVSPNAVADNVFEQYYLMALSSTEVLIQ